jgi:hypothetical protein
MDKYPIFLGEPLFGIEKILILISLPEGVLKAGFGVRKMRTFGPDFEIRGSGRADWARVLGNPGWGSQGKNSHFANF